MMVGEMIEQIYEHFMELYGDDEIATVATAATINEILGQQGQNKIEEYAA
jgi:hypothetical protein